MKNVRLLAVLILLVSCTAIVGCGGPEADNEGAIDDTTGIAGMDPAANDTTGDGLLGSVTGDSLRADLTGDAVTPGPGDPEGTGTATVSLDANAGEVCYVITVQGIADAAAAHIHEGGEGESGPPVVDFNVGENGLSGCVQAETSTIENIEQAPSDYFVMVHNSEYAGGALRGQLQ